LLKDAAVAVSEEEFKLDLIIEVFDTTEEFLKYDIKRCKE